MTDLSTYEERQEDEIDFLQAVFSNPGDFQDLRQHDSWKVRRPPEIKLTLVPQKSMGGSARDERPLSVKLLAKYTTDYPDTAPKLRVEEPQGLSSDQVKELEQEIRKLAKAKRGEVMMLELAQHVMSFLHKHDRPPVSLHQEMVRRQEEEEMKKRKQLEDEQIKFRMREVEEHRRIEEEIKRKEAEIRDQERLGLNSDEDSGDQNSSDEDSLVRSPQILPASPLSTYHTSSTYLPLTRQLDGGRVNERRARRDKNIQIKRGKLLGESMAGGYSVYVGLDVESGDLLAVYEWCFHSPKKIDARRIKQVESIQHEFENFMREGAHHPTLVQYLEVTASKPRGSANKFSVELVMEYVGGGNVSSYLRNPDTSPVLGSTLSHYSKQLLEAVSCLHSKGIVHNNIRPSVVYFDTGGRIKLGGSNVIKRLSDLRWAINSHTRHPSPPALATEDEATAATIAVGVWPAGSVDLKRGKKGDIFRMGMVLLCLATGKLEVNYPPTIPEHLPSSLRDFLAKCVDPNEQRRFPAHELLHHPFIVPSSGTPHPFTSPSFTNATKFPQQGTTLPNPTDRGPMHFQRSDSIFGSPLKPSFMGRSRLETEFEKLEVLGSGGFGDVIKVRHILDARIYALKKIQTKSDSKIMHRITREVELLSQMNHENVVRYYNAWMETYTEEEYHRHSGTHLEEDEEDESGSESSESDDEQSRSSIEFQNDTSSEESFESEDSTSVDSDSFHSANEDEIVFREDVSTLSPLDPESASNGRGLFGKGGGDYEGVFMDDFSDNSEGSMEGNNILGKLETDVMNLSMSQFRRSVTESSDTVVFADSSTPSKPVPVDKNERRREKRRTKSSDQVQFLYIQMEYCEKETLRQQIDTGDLQRSEDKVWRLFREIVEGLEHIHSKGMIHRDLKPGNIFLNHSGHIKIGDFGLAISHKHPINKTSILINTSENLSDGETGLVGTAMYMAPELLKDQFKYTSKVDIYSVGIIFFEMCHPPTSTAMERHKMLLDIRKADITFPTSFDVTRSPNQEKVIRLLLSHNPHERPSSKELLQSPLLPLKMEDEELREVLMRTLQTTNSTRFRHLIDELFAQGTFSVSEFSYFLDPQDSKRRSHSYTTKNKMAFQTMLLQQLVHSRLVSIFTHHGASSFSPPLLSIKGPLFSETDNVAEMMDRNGTIVVLPSDHRVPFARYVCYQGVSHLKRYCIAPVFRRSRVADTHPRETYECQFDIVSPNPGSLIADAEVMYVVSEIIADLPGLQEHQFSVLINHTSLLSSILTHCSIPEEKHSEALPLLYKMVSGSLKQSDLVNKLAEKNIQLSPLASKTLLRFVQSEVALESREVWPLLDLLLKDKSTGVSSQAAQTWQEITSVVAIFRQFGGKEQEITNVVAIFRQFGGKEQVYLHCGLCHSVQHFSGVIFQFVDTSSSGSASLKKNRRSKRSPLAYGGRYDKLLGAFCKPGKQTGVQAVSVVGVTVLSDLLHTAATKAYQEETCPVTKCSVLVCWLGRESLQKECLGLVRDLWAHGISADILYESMEVDSIEDVQKFCREFNIPHIVILGDKALYFERKQVKLRILESSKVVEKMVSRGELIDFLQQKHHHVERQDSTENKDLNRASGQNSEGQGTGGVPQVNITVAVFNAKLSGHLKRRYHDQTINKLLPLFQKFSMKQQLEVIIVDLKPDVLSSFSAEINKLMAGSESDYSSVARAICERHSDCNKKYIVRICDAVNELFNKKKSAVVFLYSHFAEFCQVVCNSLDSLAAAS